MCECNLCVDFFVPFTKLKECKSHVCFCVFLIYSNDSSLPTTPYHTENPPPEHTDTHHSHLPNLAAAFILLS